MSFYIVLAGFAGFGVAVLMAALMATAPARRADKDRKDKSER